MTLRPALARFERGFRRMGAWALDPLQRRRRVTEGQEVTAQETRTMLGLMAQANAAGGAMTDEQRLMLIQAAPGMRAREAVLLSIPNRSSVEENELHMIRREMAALEGRDVQPRRLLPALPAVAGIAVRPWMLWAGALLISLTWGLYSDIRAGRAELQRDEAERLAVTNRERAEAWQERAENYRVALIDAAQVARHAADALEAERERQARAAARERRRNREIQDVLSGSPDAPDWRLRDDGGADRDRGTPTG